MRVYKDERGQLHEERAFAQAVARTVWTSIVISEARVVGSSTTPSDARAGLRVGTSQHERDLQTFSSISE